MRAKFSLPPQISATWHSRSSPASLTITAPQANTMHSVLSLTTLAVATAAALVSSAPSPTKRQDGAYGFDVSHNNGNSGVDMSGAASNGATFVYIKATEGISFADPAFSANSQAAANAGLYQGSYHFARPDKSSGADQANYFIQHDGGWSSGYLPGAVDLEKNPYGDTCYDLSADDLVSWIQDFGDTYQASQGVYPVIYTSTSWVSLGMPLIRTILTHYQSPSVDTMYRQQRSILKLSTLDRTVQLRHRHPPRQLESSRLLAVQRHRQQPLSGRSGPNGQRRPGKLG